MATTEPLNTLIIGAGGHGKVVLDILRSTNKYRPIGFIDADPKLANTLVGNLSVFGGIHLLNRLKQQHNLKAAIIAIGDNRTRAGYVKTIEEHGLTLINAIHPSATVSSTATLGRNVVIAAGVIIAAEAKIADLAIINNGAIIDHETEIGTAAHICPGATIAGRVRVESNAFIGLGASIIQCLTIGQNATVGAGAVVLTDIPPNATAVGVPARIIKVLSLAA
jgi:sugar O-acyltransferase (sialic acid O-acetyltransferase NeuD family)